MIGCGSRADASVLDRRFRIRADGAIAGAPVTGTLEARTGLVVAKRYPVDPDPVRDCTVDPGVQTGIALTARSALPDDGVWELTSTSGKLVSVSRFTLAGNGMVVRDFRGPIASSYSDDRGNVIPCTGDAEGGGGLVTGGRPPAGGSYLWAVPGAGKGINLNGVFRGGTSFSGALGILGPQCDAPAGGAQLLDATARLVAPEGAGTPPAAGGAQAAQGQRLRRPARGVDRAGLLGEVKAGPLTGRAACWRAKGDAYESDGRARVNGIDITPVRPGTRVVIDRRTERLRSTGPVEVRLGTLRLLRATLDWRSRTQVFSLKWAKDQKLLGLPVDGSAQLTLEGGATKLKVSVQIPKDPRLALLRRVARWSGDLTAAADNDRGLVLDGATVKFPGFSIGFVDVRDASLAFAAQPAGGFHLDGSAEVYPFRVSTVGFIGQLGFGTADGYLKLGIGVEQLNRPLFAGFFLQKLAGSLQVNPFGLAGSAGVTFGPQVRFRDELISSAPAGRRVLLPGGRGRRAGLARPHRRARGGGGQAGRREGDRVGRQGGRDGQRELPHRQVRRRGQARRLVRRHAGVRPGGQRQRVGPGPRPGRRGRPLRARRRRVPARVRSRRRVRLPLGRGAGRDRRARLVVRPRRLARGPRGERRAGGRADGPRAARGAHAGPVGARRRRGTARRLRRPGRHALRALGGRGRRRARGPRVAVPRRRHARRVPRRRRARTRHVADRAAAGLRARHPRPPGAPAAAAADRRAGPRRAHAAVPHPRPRRRARPLRRGGRADAAHDRRRAPVARPLPPAARARPGRAPRHRRRRGAPRAPDGPRAHRGPLPGPAGAPGRGRAACASRAADPTASSPGAGAAACATTSSPGSATAGGCASSPRAGDRGRGSRTCRAACASGWPSPRSRRAGSAARPCTPRGASVDNARGAAQGCGRWRRQRTGAVGTGRSGIR